MAGGLAFNLMEQRARSRGVVLGHVLDLAAVRLRGLDPENVAIEAARDGGDCARGLAVRVIKRSLADRAGLILDPLLDALAVIGVGDHVTRAGRVGISAILQEVTGRDRAVASTHALGCAIGVGRDLVATTGHVGLNPSVWPQTTR